MNTYKFTGDMSSQVEADRDQLVEMREVLRWSSENTVSARMWTDLSWSVERSDMKRFTAPTLYAALHAAWSNRGKT